MSTIWRGFFILLAAAGWIAWGPAAALAQTKPAVTSAIGKQPELNLYAPDKRHPSLAGTYLATCVVFAALTGRSPVGNSYLAGIDAPTAQLLQTVAWETVQEYYRK